MLEKNSAPPLLVSSMLGTVHINIITYIILTLTFQATELITSTNVSLEIPSNSFLVRYTENDPRWGKTMMMYLIERMKSRGLV